MVRNTIWSQQCTFGLVFSILCRQMWTFTVYFTRIQTSPGGGVTTGQCYNLWDPRQSCYKTTLLLNMDFLKRYIHYFYTIHTYIRYSNQEGTGLPYSLHVNTYSFITCCREFTTTTTTCSHPDLTLFTKGTAAAKFKLSVLNKYCSCRHTTPCDWLGKHYRYSVTEENNFLIQSLNRMNWKQYLHLAPPPFIADKKTLHYRHIRIYIIQSS